MVFSVRAVHTFSQTHTSVEEYLIGNSSTNICISIGDYSLPHMNYVVQYVLNPSIESSYVNMLLSALMLVKHPHVHNLQQYAHIIAIVVFLVLITFVLHNIYFAPSESLLSPDSYRSAFAFKIQIIRTQ